MCVIQHGAEMNPLTETANRGSRDGATLKIWYDLPDRNRPTEFKNAGAYPSLFAYKREKPSAAYCPAARASRTRARVSIFLALPHFHGLIEPAW